MNNSQSKDIEKAIKLLSKNDTIMSRIIKKNDTCNLKPHRNFFKELIHSIIGQQLSVKAANAIINRFMSFFNYKLLPERILETPHEELRSLGLSNAKARYVKDLSQKIVDKVINIKKLNKKSNEEVITELTKVTGIGIWTSHMFLIFTLGRLNILPYSDLGIRKAVMFNYGFEILPTKEQIISLAEEKGWQPYSSVAAWYLWRTLD